MVRRRFYTVGFSVATLVAGCGTDVNSGGTGGTGGSGGSNEVPTKDPAGPKDADELFKAAVVVATCAPDTGIQSLLQQLYTRRGDTSGGFNTLDFSHCLATAGGGCAALQKCMGTTVDGPAMPCAASCAGNVLTVCGDSQKYKIDCSKFELSCSVSEAHCVLKNPGPVCDSGTFMESCKNGAPFLCGGPGSTEHELSGPLCADYGLACGDVGNGYYGCIGSGPACQASGGGGSLIDYSSGISCNGAKLKACIGGFEQDIDCGTIANGLSCQTFGTTSFCGHAAECDAMTADNATCEGDNVVLCNAGRIEKLDCKLLGFTGCNAKFGACSPSVFDNF